MFRPVSAKGVHVARVIVVLLVGMLPAAASARGGSGMVALEGKPTAAQLRASKRMDAQQRVLDASPAATLDVSAGPQARFELKIGDLNDRVYAATGNKMVRWKQNGRVGAVYFGGKSHLRSAKVTPQILGALHELGLTLVKHRDGYAFRRLPRTGRPASAR